MRTTLIDESNIRAFIPEYEETIGEDDFLIGAYDEKTDNACGVLIAKRISALEAEIRNIYVAKDFRNRQAGSRMLRYLQDISYEEEIETLLCMHEREYDGDPFSRFLEKNCFAENEDLTTDVYSAAVDEIIDVEATEQAKRIEEFAERQKIHITPLNEVDTGFWKVLAKQWGSVDDLKRYADFFCRIKDRVDNDCSFTAEDTHGIIGILLISHNEDGRRLEGLRMYGRHSREVAFLLAKRAIAVIKATSEPDDRIWVAPETSSGVELLKYITNDNYIKERESVLFVWNRD